jgi:hypothetical protein
LSDISDKPETTSYSSAEENEYEIGHNVTPSCPLIRRKTIDEPLNHSMPVFMREY